MLAPYWRRHRWGSGKDQTHRSRRRLRITTSMHRKTIQLVLDLEARGEAPNNQAGGSEPGSVTSDKSASAQEPLRTQPIARVRLPLMEAIVSNSNMRRALKRVRANKGSSG